MFQLDNFQKNPWLTTSPEVYCQISQFDTIMAIIAPCSQEEWPLLHLVFVWSHFASAGKEGYKNIITWTRKLANWLYLQVKKIPIQLFEKWLSYICVCSNQGSYFGRRRPNWDAHLTQLKWLYYFTYFHFPLICWSRPETNGTWEPGLIELTSTCEQTIYICVHIVCTRLIRSSVRIKCVRCIHFCLSVPFIF